MFTATITFLFQLKRKCGPEELFLVGANAPRSVQSARFAGIVPPWKERAVIPIQSNKARFRNK